MHHELVLAATVPEKQPLSTNQHDLILYAIVVAGFALFASFIHSWHSNSEVSTRYRPAVFASMCITGVAFLSYVVLLVKFDSGYDLVGGTYRPNSEALFSIAPRYMDWSVTVPLLTVELLAVCTLVGRKLSAARTTAMAAAFLMIVTGYFGSQVFSEGRSDFWLWLWFAISCVFFVILYVVLVPAVLTSVTSLPSDAARALTQGSGLLFVIWLVYPVVYLIPIFFSGGWWTTSMQVAYSAADVIAKVGFGMLIHRCAKLRTAADIVAGEDTHPEPVWVNSEHHSDGVQAAQRPLTDGLVTAHSGHNRHGAHEAPTR